MKAGAIALACALSAGSASARVTQLSDFFGSWKITRIAGYGDVSSGPEYAKQGLGKTVTISTDSVLLPSDPCDRHTLTFEMADVDAVLASGWEATRQDLDLGHFKLGKRAGRLHSGCADALVLDRNDLLMTSGEGAFYIVRRQ